MVIGNGQKSGRAKGLATLQKQALSDLQKGTLLGK